MGLVVFIVVQLIDNTLESTIYKGKSWACGASLGHRFGSVYVGGEEIGSGQCCEVGGWEKPVWIVLSGGSHRCPHEILCWLSMQAQYPSQRLGLHLPGEAGSLEKSGYFYIFRRCRVEHGFCCFRLHQVQALERGVFPELHMSLVSNMRLGNHSQTCEAQTAGHGQDVGCGGR